MQDSKIKFQPIEGLNWYEPSDATEAGEPVIADKEQAVMLVMRAALIETTASRGWPFVEKFAETVLRDLEAQALAEDDDVKSVGLRRDARGARKFKEEIFRRIRLACNIEKQDFVEVVTD